MNGALFYLHALDEPGEEAAGWHLAGARTLCAATADAVPLLTEVRRTAAMIVLSPAFAAQLPSAALDDALAALHPLTVMLPSDPLHAADPAERVRRQLGLDTATA
jgi:hypothetical protein